MIDGDKNEKVKGVSRKILNQIKIIRDKDRCFDFFYYTRVNEMKMYPNYQAIGKLVHYRAIKKRLEKVRNIMRLLKAMKAHSGFGKCTFIEICLHEI